jgi:Ion channel
LKAVEGGYISGTLYFTDWDIPRARTMRIWKLPRTISDVHPLTYILIYFSMIPVFASFYYCMPAGAFYAPYARLEPAGARDLNRVAAMLEGALKRSLQGREIATQGAKLIDLHLFNPRSTDGSAVIFNVMGVFRPVGDSHEGSASAPQPFAVDLPGVIPAHVSMLIGPRPDETANILVPIVFDVSAHPVSFQAIETEVANQLLPTLFFPTGRGLMLTRKEDAELSLFFDGLQGNPIAVSWAFPRMLYFSAIVATTVGFGDIVPMIPIARFALAAQAVLSIAVAGLFLNALAFRASKRD